MSQVRQELQTMLCGQRLITELQTGTSSWAIPNESVLFPVDTALVQPHNEPIPWAGRFWGLFLSSVGVKSILQPVDHR
jgi:hypothetical protein